MKVNSRQSQSPVLGWAQRLPAPDGSLPPRAPASRVAGGASRPASASALPLLLATYLGAAACATPRYVSDNHAALQSPVTLGDGHTGKPALDELPKAPAPAPAVHLAPCAPAVHPAPGSPQPNAAEANAATSASGASQPTAATSAVGATTSGLDASQPTSPTSASQPTAAEPAAAPSGTTTSTVLTAVHPMPGTESVTTSTPSGAATALGEAQPSASATSPAAGAATTAPGTAPAGASATRARLQPFGLHSRVTKPRTAAAPAPGASQSSAVTTAPGASAATATPCAASTGAPAVSGASAAPAGTPAVAGAPASATSVAALLEGEPTETAPGSADAAASAAAPFDPRATPDPKDQATDAYYELTLRYCNAGVHLVKNRRVKLGKPSILPRRMGRFAAELWIGHELLERARFDFPMTAADTVAPAGTARPEPPPLQLAPGTDVVWKVKVADRVRATQAWVIDRATGERWLLDWPPAATKAKPTADAGCPSFGGK